MTGELRYVGLPFQEMVISPVDVILVGIVKRQCLELFLNAERIHTLTHLLRGNVEICILVRSKICLAEACADLPDFHIEIYILCLVNSLGRAGCNEKDRKWDNRDNSLHSHSPSSLSQVFTERMNLRAPLMCEP